VKRNSATQLESWAPTRQAAPAPDRRPDGTFRFSGRFIKMATTVLVSFMLVSVIAGFVLGALSDTVARDARDDLVTAAGTLIIGGITLPLLLAVVLGGEAIRAGGGFIGLFLILGMLAAVAGGTELGQEMLGRTWTPWALWGGIALMALATASFWIVGWIARVPMWLQGPFLGSPRVIVRGSSDNPADIVLPNDLDDRRT